MVLEPACGRYFDRINCRSSIFDNSRNPVIKVKECLCRENFLLGKAIELNSSEVVVEQLLQLKEFFRLRKVHNKKEIGIKNKE